MLIDAGSHRIHFDLLGPDEAPVVCLAHSLSSDSGIWAEQVSPLLAAGWRVLRIDMRGHGGSGVPAGPYAMADLAGDVIAVLDFLGLEKMHFVGLSIGGMIGQQLALDHAARLHSLMLTGTSPKAVPGPPQMWPERFAAIREAGSVAPIADATMTRWFTEQFRPAHENRWQQVRSMIANTSPEGYIAGAEAIINFDVLERLPSVRMETLVVCGDDDPGTPAEGNRKIAALIPGAHYQEVARARHIPMVEHPELFSRILLGWLDGQR
jgi:3-oxoadipate enol-lactonase